MPYKDKEKHRAVCRAWYHKNKVQAKKNVEEYRKTRYRIRGIGYISIKEYDLRFAAQNGKCDICRRPLLYRHIATHFDHNHMTLQLRGLLCGTCNAGIGQFQENETFLQSAIEYLKKYR